MKKDVLLPVLPKPKFGEPCNGCGHCCKEEVCLIGEAVFGKVAAPCPGLEVKSGRYWCSLIGMVASEEHRVFLMYRMGIGMGCDSDDPPSGFGQATSGK